MKILLALTLLTWSTPAIAFDFTTPPPVHHSHGLEMQSLFPDVFPNDGVLDAGTIANPLFLEGRNGARYEIKPEWPDVFPNDGVLDAGSLANPWEVEPMD